ncbi:MAG: EAL domain-containing protein, partial [Acidimicrobiia bacterium]
MSDLPTIPVTEAPSNDVPVLDRARLMGTIRVLRDLKDRAPIVSIAYLDLDRFHQVNTRWGHRLGDQLLSVVERRLRGAVPHGSVLARLDGDGFVVLVPGMDGEDIRVLAEMLLRLVATPVSLDGRVVAVRASAGVVTRTAPIGEDLVEEAFMACRQAKSTNVGMVEESVLAAMVARRGQVEAELARGIENSELRLRYQPKVDLRDGTVVGVEALVRWQHPEMGLVGPGAFIDIAEESGLIVPLGAWVLQAAIEQARRWPATISGAPLRTWVNLSAAQLGHIADLRTILRDAIAGGLDPRAIGFEVTESSLLADLPGAVEVLESLRSLGAELALDDFGTGYSSLTYLRQLPVSSVKIDRSFVTGMDGSLADAAIVEAVVELSHALGLEVVAEGVEEAHQVDELLRLGVDRAQGYWFAEPLPAFDMAALVAQPWCGKPAPAAARERDHRADGLPGFGGPRSRLLLAALDASADSVMVSSVGDLVAGIAPHIDYVNPAFEADTGYRTDQVLGRPVWFNYPEDLEGALARDALMSALQSRVSSTLVVPSVRADGDRRQCELTVTPIMDERGMLSHWLHVRRDLTSRHALEADRDRFRRVIEQTAVGVVLTEIDGSVTYANQAARDLVSFPADRPLDGTDLMSLIPADEIDEHHARVFPLLRRDGEFAGPVTAVASDGQRVPLWVDIRIVQDPRHPRGAYLAAVAQDRRPELAVAEALAASSRRAQELLSGTADAVVLLDPAGRITYANRALETLLGAPMQQLIGSSAFSWISPTHREQLLQSFIDQLAEDSDGGEEQEFVFNVVHVDGTEIPVEAAVVRRFHDPTINGLVMSLRDMRRRLASERRDHQQTLFDRLLAAVAQSALDLGPEGFFAVLDDHLGELAEALDVDRIFVNEIGSTHVTTLASVDTIDLPPTDPTVPRGQLTSWIEMLERQDRVVIDDLVVDPHDAIAREAEVYEAVPRALAAVALRSEGRLTATIGALHVARPRRWERQEIDVLARCGATIVHVLEQRRLDRALRES